jgi:hypothetical protein
MDAYKRRPMVETPASSLPGVVTTVVNEVTRTARRLIPYPGGSDSLAGLARSVLPGVEGATGATTDAMPSGADEHAAGLIAQAASILDAEMAKGVLAARRSGTDRRYGFPEDNNMLLRQVHDLVDHVAKAWPDLQYLTSTRSPAYESASGSVPLPELKPRSAVKPGQRATLSMTVCNKEAQTVRLVPQITDLLGSGGGRIAASLLQCTPASLDLEPQAQSDISISLTVPADVASGSYSGVLVMRGVGDLRALITVDVA